MSDRRRSLFGAYFVLAALLFSCGDGDAKARAEGTASSKGGGHADLYREAPLLAGQSPRPIVKLTTTLGPLTVELDRRAAPGTTQNFIDYVRAGFYADTLLHRIVPGVLAHGGGRAANGASKARGPAIRFEGENGKSHRRGTIAMWRDPADPQAATSEFFFNLTDNDGKRPGAKNFDFQSTLRGPAAFGYCVFGKVKDEASLAVLDRIGALPTTSNAEFAGENSKPVDAPRVLSAEVVTE